jgi:hypothetical protein
MANTYTQIGSTVTVGAGGASSIDFSSIPNTYTDLTLKLSLKNDRDYNFDNCYLQFNADTGSNYSSRLVYGWNSPGSSSSSAVANIEYIYAVGSKISGSVGNTFSNTEIYIPNYAGSNQKILSTDAVNEGNTATDILVGFAAQRWTGTAAINAIKIYSISGNFVQYSTASLYGIKNS